MAQIRKYLVAGGTFSFAMAVGFVMQNGDALASRMVAEQPAAPSALGQPLPEQAAAAPAVPQMPQPLISAALGVPAALMAPEPPPAPVELAAVERDAPVSDALPDDFMALDLCIADMTATAGPAATVVLDITAPCAVNAAVTIHHQGMIFSVLTDGDGRATVSAPALAPNAVFIADLPDGYGAAAVIGMPDVAYYDRAVLQWQGNSGLGIHALEFGSSYSGDGHVWAASTRSVDAVQDGTGGFMMRLGDVGVEGAFLAEVYTYPSTTSQQGGQIELSVEVEVLPGNCGRAIAAQSIQISPGSDPAALDLTMTLPDCDAVGEFLVLNNMLRSLTLAAR